MLSSFKRFPPMVKARIERPGGCQGDRQVEKENIPMTKARRVLMTLMLALTLAAGIAQANDGVHQAAAATVSGHIYSYAAYPGEGPI